MRASPDLYTDIPRAKNLDSRRDSLTKMKKHGIAGLTDRLHLYNNRIDPKWDAPGDKWDAAGDLVEKAILAYSLRNEINAPGGKPILETEVRELADLSVAKAFKAVYEPTTRSGVDNVPALRAVKVLRALSALPNYSASEGALASYLRIMYAVNLVRPQDDLPGGASAGGSRSPQTAFVTCGCVCAVLAFAKVFQNTALVFEQFQRMKGSTPPGCVPEAWWKVHAENVVRASQVCIRSLKARILTQVDDSFDAPDITEAARLLTELRGKLVTAITDLHNLAIKLTTDPRPKGVDKPTYDTAAKALTILASQLPTSSITLDDDVKMAEALKDAAKAIRASLEPARRYLRSVVDHELAAGTVHGDSPADAAELVFAADGLAQLESEDETSLSSSLEKAVKMLSHNGRLPSHKPFDVAGKGYAIHVVSAEVIAALADLAGRLSCSLTVDDVDKLIQHLRDTWNEKSKGWRHELNDSQGNCSWSFSGLAVIALDSLVHMLDRMINDTVLSNFSVRSYEKLTVNLDDLFYSDYGLIAAGIRESRHGLFQLFQELRANVLGGAKNGPRSAILYGPPGTGKTTLVEALAKSCGVDMVEITPSDILLGGAEHVETRARSVFEGLAMLTDVVILFDEFDPILWRRAQGGVKDSIFQFLTPGMLPKLKSLNESAVTNRMAFILSTNLIGGLDEAATREGRFDKKLGVYPPDALSRAGQLTHIFADTLDDAKEGRLMEMVEGSAGRGMNRLGKPCWFSKPRPDSKCECTPYTYISLGHMAHLPEWPDPEKKLPDSPFSDYITDPKVPDPKINKEATKEWVEWSFVNWLDLKVSKSMKLAVLARIFKSLKENSALRDVLYEKMEETDKKYGLVGKRNSGYETVLQEILEDATQPKTATP